MSAAITAVAAGAAVSYYGASQSASAAKKAAGAQADAAGSWLNDIHKKEQDALSKIQTPSQLAAYDQALHGQEQNVSRMESLAKSLDPALIDAGKQTTQLLQGHSAPVLGQIQAQRDLQRKQMLDNLRTQVGPGAETSSIGQQAMQQFDMQTSNMMNEVQQQYLSQVSGLALGGATTLGDLLSKVNATLTDIQKNSPGAQAADIMARFTAAENGAQEAKVQAAGGQYAGDQIMGQAVGNLGSSLMSAGAMYGAVGQLKGKAAVPGGTDAAAGAAGVAGGAGENAQFTMPNMGDSAYGGTPGGPSLLGGSVNAPTAVAARSAGAGIPSTEPYHSSPSLLPFSNNYGQHPYPSQFGFNPNAPFIGGSGGGGNIAGGGDH